MPTHARGVAPAMALAAMLLLAGCPEISVEPGSGPAGAEQLVLQVAGTNTSFSVGSTTAEFLRAGVPSGIVIDDLTVTSPTALLLTVSIPPGEPEGPQVLRVRTGSEEAETTFTVTERPSISLSPPAVEQGEKGMLVQVHGSSTSFAPATFAVDVQVGGVQVVSHAVLDKVTAEVRLDVGLGAPVGLHPEAFRVYTDHQWISADLEILPVTGRAITLSPDWGEQGQAVTVAVLGTKTDFLNAAQFRLEPEDHVDIYSVTVVSDSELTLELGIHSIALPGPRQVVVDDGYGELSASFAILADPTPPSLQLDPFYGLPGDSLVVQVAGTNTSFASGVTTVAVDPPGQGVTATLLSISSPTAATLRLDIDPLCAPQAVGILLTTGLEHARGSFEVLPTPEVFLDPAAWYQREPVSIAVTGMDTHFVQGNTDASVAPGSGLSILDFRVTGPESAELDIYVSMDATGVHPISFVDSWGLPAQADFTVLPGRPAVELSPTGLPQGSRGAPVTATGYFLTWGSDVTVTVEPDCAPFVQVTDPQPLHPAASKVTFHVDVNLLAPIRECLIDFSYGDLPKHASAVLQILPGYTETSVPQDLNWYLTAPYLFAVDLAADEVLRARVLRDPFTFVDPVLELYAEGTGLLDLPLAGNDDESEATVNARVVYRAPTTGRYYLLVRDRLGFNVGHITLSLDWYEPELALEVDAGGTIELAEPLSHRLLRGLFEGDGGGGSTGDATDIFEVDWTHLALPQASSQWPWDRVLVQVIARSVSPFETSGAEALLQLLDPAGQVLAEAAGSPQSPDPALLASPAEVGFIALVNQSHLSQGHATTTYWLNLRPVVVINEVFHDEERAWEASFVELQGEPGLELGACRLVALGADSGGLIADPLFDVSLAGRSLGPWGYHVVGRDELVPGVTHSEAVPELSINDPTGSLTDIGIALVCNHPAPDPGMGEVVLDAVCYRGGNLPVCEGAPALDTGPRGLDPGQSIGRGFLLDTDRNDMDFIPQVEPSPWQRNYSEVW